MAHKVKVIKIIKKRAKDVLLGEAFTIHGDNFVMIEPVYKHNKSMSLVLFVPSEAIGNITNIEAVMHKNEIVTMHVPVKTKKISERKVQDVENR